MENLTAESPLAEGRELKYLQKLASNKPRRSPLAEGRELKYHSADTPADDITSPLAEGRELKYEESMYAGLPGTVAPRGGA